jgi:hypothetical protein
MPEDATLGVDAFVRSVGVNKATPHALFLGAGASINSGVPSAASCIWEWKRSIFLTNNPGLEAQFSELSLPAVRSKIQRWLDNQGKYPANDASDEYGFYIQACYPIAEDRRAFFQEKTILAVPHIGYRLLIELAKSGLISTVWTPNFDGLAAKAAALSTGIAPIEVGIDCQARLPRRPNRNEILCVSLHGDYRYDYLKNTGEELQEQEAALRKGFIDEARLTPVIVIGYSGRDASLLEAFGAAYSQTGTGTLYWCGFGDAEVPTPVRRLIEKARAAGRSAYYIPAGGFDDLLRRITLHCLRPAESVEAVQLVQSQEREPTDVRADFFLPDLPTSGISKSNAFPFIPPGEVFEFELTKWPEQKSWDYFEKCTEGKLVVAVPFKSKGYAFGTIDDIRLAFKGNLRSKIERVPINDVDLQYDDGAINSLVRRAVVSVLASRARVSTDGRRLLWKPSPRERRKENGEVYLIHDAVLLYTRRYADKNYLVLKPTVRIESPTGKSISLDVERNLKNKILGWQHNAEFNQAVEEWRKLLLTQKEFEFPPNCGSGFKFQVQRTPVMAKLTARDTKKPIGIQEKYLSGITQVAVELPEPRLLFSDRQGSRQVADPHPVRGVLKNRPFDYPLTTRQLSSNIQIGVVCPAQESKRLSLYLQTLEKPIKPGQYEEDYLLPFPGFQNAFGVALQIPEPGDNLWVTCPDVDPTIGQEKGALETSRHITSCLSSLKAAASPNVTIIFVPARWANWRTFETESERFDLHNFIKAFCVPQGIGTQFLEEDTLQNQLQCRIRWWLSLAIYAKSMRTPWVLESMESDSAFVGLGMSLERKAQRGSHVILGCSHLYNAQGEGLQFRLSKIENPIFRRRNAFMSYDDARRVGETIRQLFWESRFRLPSRVVIHKLTPFLSEERRGLQAGLTGVKEIDLLEIHQEDALRYLSSIPQANGTFKEDKYPVKRGTLLKLDADSALLWVHGVSNVVESGRGYYQGKRRIPAPLVIRRHAGKSDLTMVAGEILGLSKMNWNSFELYTKVPATIESSRQIARIGSLLERFGSTSYDYRLFM